MQKCEGNIKLNEIEMEQGKVVLESKPRMLMLVLTTRCNLECIMCSRAYPKSNTTLPFEAIQQICSLFPYLEAIDWQGGEVFLVDYFKQLFLEARSYQNISQSIISNGLLIDEEWAKIFAESKVNLTYSIDAVTKETYEYIRKGSSFENLLRSIELINEYNSKYNGSIQLHINVVVMKSNYRELHLFPEFCKKYNVKHLRFDFLQPDVIPEEDILIQPDIEAIKYLRSELKEIEEKTKNFGIWFEYTFQPFLSVPQRDCSNTNSGTNSGLKKEIAADDTQFKLKCKLPWKKLFIEASGNGSVRPDCLCVNKVGNIMENSIDSIWNNKMMQLYRQNLVAGNIQNWCSEICLSNAVDQYHLEGRG